MGVSLLDYRDQFVQIVRWCDNTLEWVVLNSTKFDYITFDGEQLSYDEVYDKIDYVRRNCKILIRKINLTVDKYMSDKELPMSVHFPILSDISSTLTMSNDIKKFVDKIKSS